TPTPLRRSRVPYPTLFRSAGDDEGVVNVARIFDRDVQLVAELSDVGDAQGVHRRAGDADLAHGGEREGVVVEFVAGEPAKQVARSEEHTSELQSREKLVCR